jgi:hypothetical protein
MAQISRLETIKKEPLYRYNTVVRLVRIAILLKMKTYLTFLARPFCEIRDIQYVMVKANWCLIFRLLLSWIAQRPLDCWLNRDRMQE